MRIAKLLLVCVLLLGACTRELPERPREGALPGVDSRAERGDEGRAPSPTSSPAVPPGAPLPPAQPTSSAAPESTSSPPPSPSPAYVIVATDGAGANLRTGPSTAASVITTLAEGTRVEVLGDPVSVEGREWRPIRSGDREGWVVSVVVRQR